MAAKIPNNWFTKDQVMVMAHLWASAKGDHAVKIMKIIDEHYQRKKTIVYAIKNDLKLTEVKHNGRIYYEQDPNFEFNASKY